MARTLAQQLGNPSAFWAGWIFPRLWNRRNRALNDVVLQVLALRPQDRVLEIGFGGGYLLSRIAAIASDGFVAGVDIAPAMVAFGEKRLRPWIQSGKVAVRVASAERLPFADGCFDKVCSVNSIFYWSDAAGACAEMQRVLVEGGMMALCFTERASLAGRSFAQHSLHLYEAAEVRGLLQVAGFHEITMIPGSDRHREFVCVTARKSTTSLGPLPARL